MKDPAQKSGANQATTSESLPLDVLFQALSDQRRRYVLRHLDELRTPVARTDLAVEIAASERDTSVDEIDDEDVAEVAVSLYHAHLPKLANLGLVEYDLEEDLVRPSEHRDEVDRFLDIGATDE